MKELTPDFLFEKVQSPASKLYTSAGEARRFTALKGRLIILRICQLRYKETKIETNFPVNEISENSLKSSIGNTLLIRLRTITKDLPAGIEIYGKAEFINPGDGANTARLRQ